MSERPVETQMIHYECLTCGMAATCVVTSSSSLAWLDHMETHVEKRNYRQWTWTVTPLPV